MQSNCLRVHRNKCGKWDNNHISQINTYIFELNFLIIYSYHVCNFFVKITCVFQAKELLKHSEFSTYLTMFNGMILFQSGSENVLTSAKSIVSCCKSNKKAAGINWISCFGPPHDGSMFSTYSLQHTSEMRRQSHVCVEHVIWSTVACGRLNDIMCQMVIYWPL